MQLLRKLLNEGKITNKDIQEMYGISDNAAIKIIRKLFNLKS